MNKEKDTTYYSLNDVRDKFFPDQKIVELTVFVSKDASNSEILRKLIEEARRRYGNDGEWI